MFTYLTIVLILLALLAGYLNFGLRRCLAENEANGYGPRTPMEWLVFRLVMKLIEFSIVANRLEPGTKRQRWYRWLEQRWRQMIHCFNLPDRRWTFTTSQKTISWEVRGQIVYVILDSPNRKEPGWLIALLRGTTAADAQEEVMDANWLYVTERRTFGAPVEKT